MYTCGCCVIIGGGNGTSTRISQVMCLGIFIANFILSRELKSIDLLKLFTQLLVEIIHFIHL